MGCQWPKPYLSKFLWSKSCQKQQQSLMSSIHHPTSLDLLKERCGGNAAYIFRHYQHAITAPCMLCIHRAFLKSSAACASRTARMVMFGARLSAEETSTGGLCH
mmetsp:Transcript_16193/g.44283  ORF Transcript_16193/g.44283 Transcript_16193/m.44283 type:complete len:104 (+) Transcript_16193:586-897(+)